MDRRSFLKISALAVQPLPQRHWPHLHTHRNRTLTMVTGADGFFRGFDDAAGISSTANAMADAQSPSKEGRWPACQCVRLHFSARPHDMSSPITILWSAPRLLLHDSRAVWRDRWRCPALVLPECVITVAQLAASLV
jgi:hypothetical protein